MNLRYRLNSGKNSKLLYYIKSHIYYRIPALYSSRSLEAWLHIYDALPQSEKCYIDERVSYYCKLDSRATLPADSPTLKEHKFNKKLGYSTPYFFDSYEYTRYFPPYFRWSYIFGDVTTVAPIPSIVKSRPLRRGDNSNSVLLKLNKNRHYVKIYDSVRFEDKLDMGIFRAALNNNEKRVAFVERYYGHPLCDVGVVSRKAVSPQKWRRDPISIYEHLKYKFVFAFEGVDVATNLKWIMSSNSVAVMPKPSCETWFMEGCLEAGVHYIEVADDLSDVEEKLQYYIDHPDKAKRIAANANRYMSQFWNQERESLISILVLRRYFEATGQV